MAWVNSSKARTHRAPDAFGHQGDPLRSRNKPAGHRTQVTTSMDGAYVRWVQPQHMSGSHMSFWHQGWLQKESGESDHRKFRFVPSRVVFKFKTDVASYCLSLNEANKAPLSLQTPTVLQRRSRWAGAEPPPTHNTPCGKYLVQQ